MKAKQPAAAAALQSHRALLTLLTCTLAALPTLRLTLRSGWWSDKKSLFDLSMVTGLTVTRLDQLEAQCRAWKGPLTAAVYLAVHVPPGGTKIDGPGLEAVQEAEQKMAEFHQRCALERVQCWRIGCGLSAAAAATPAVRLLRQCHCTKPVPATACWQQYVHSNNRSAAATCLQELLC